MKIYTLEDFKHTTGQAKLTFRCKHILHEADLQYEEISDDVITKQQVWKAIETSNNVLSPIREQHWEACWAKTLTSYQKHSELWNLTPDYFYDPYQSTLRLDGRFIKPGMFSFHLNFWRALRTQLFEYWLMDTPAIYEIGSGSAWNLAVIKQLCPKTKCYGLDWSPSAVALASLVGDGGWRFDLRHPAPVFTPDNFAVLTCGALEQIGSDYELLLAWLLQQQPSLCLHIEPLLELYNPTDPFDQLAIDYHQARGYLQEFLPALQRLQDRGKIELLEIHRVRFGGIYNEGYSYVVWRPV